MVMIMKQPPAVIHITEEQMKHVCAYGIGCKGPNKTRCQSV